MDQRFCGSSRGEKSGFGLNQKENDFHSRSTTGRIIGGFFGEAGGGGVGTRPWWLALLACGGAYWPVALEPSAMTSRRPQYHGHPHCCGHPPAWGLGDSRMQLLPMASSPNGLTSARYAVITKTPGWEVLTTRGGGGGQNQGRKFSELLLRNEENCWCKVAVVSWWVLECCCHFWIRSSAANVVRLDFRQRTQCQLTPRLTSILRIHTACSTQKAPPLQPMSSAHISAHRTLEIEINFWYEGGLPKYVHINFS